MGGYGSTRWGWERTRRDTEGQLRLDVRHMHRTGVFQPGTRATWQWTNSRGEPSNHIVTHMNEAGDRLTVDYATRAPGDTDWTPRMIHVWLETTPCRYGGERVWFRCPGCRTRRTVLFSAGGVFACRACHDLAYTSTREDAMDRRYRTIRKLQQRLGAPSGYDAWRIPDRPAGMHGTTYERLASQLYDAIMEREAIFEARALKLIGRGDRLLADRGVGFE